MTWEQLLLYYTVQVSAPTHGHRGRWLLHSTKHCIKKVNKLFVSIEEGLRYFRFFIYFLVYLVVHWTFNTFHYNCIQDSLKLDKVFNGVLSTPWAPWVVRVTSVLLIHLRKMRKLILEYCRHVDATWVPGHQVSV